MSVSPQVAWVPGPGELVVIALVILLLFGSTKIPSLMRGLGQGFSEFRKGLKEGREDEKKKGKDE